MDPASLVGAWRHAHEEDSGEERVFRSADQPLPPSRGRLEIVLGPGGRLGGTRSGPADAPVASSGSWRVEGGELVIAPAGAPTTRYLVVRCEPGCLVLRKRS